MTLGSRTCRHATTCDPTGRRCGHRVTHASGRRHADGRPRQRPAPLRPAACRTREPGRCRTRRSRPGAVRREVGPVLAGERYRFRGSSLCDASPTIVARARRVRHRRLRASTRCQLPQRRLRLRCAPPIIQSSNHEVDPSADRRERSPPHAVEGSRSRIPRRHEADTELNSLVQPRQPVLQPNRENRATDGEE